MIILPEYPVIYSLYICCWWKQELFLALSHCEDFSLLCYFRVLLSHPWTMFLYLCIDFSRKLNRRASLHISGNFSLFSSLISSTLFYNAYVFWSPQTPSSVASFQGPRLAASGFPFPACDLETFYRYEELTELKGSTSKEKQTEMS